MWQKISCPLKTQPINPEHNSKSPNNLHYAKLSKYITPKFNTVFPQKRDIFLNMTNIEKNSLCRHLMTKMKEMPQAVTWETNMVPHKIRTTP